MTIEIRPVRSDEMTSAKDVAASTIVMPPGIFPPEFTDGITPEMTLCAFVDGNLATSYAAWPLMMRLNGASVPVAGVTFVGTLPVYRRRGCLRRVATRHFEMMYERGEQAIAILHASHAAIYQRYGYAVVSTRKSYRIAPMHLSPTTEFVMPQGHAIKDVSRENDHTAFYDIYNQFILDRTGYLERTPRMWRMGVLMPPMPSTILQKIIYTEAGRPSGYLIYSAEPHVDANGQLGQRIVVRDFAWLTPHAYLGLVTYFMPMDLAHEIVWPKVPEDDPLPHLLLEPRYLFPTMADGILGRMVDLERALTHRRYDHEGQIVMEVRDPICHWNRGRWKITTTTGRAIVSRSDEPAELYMTIDTLTLLFFGQVSATQASRMGRLKAMNTAVLFVADRLFETRYKPFCADIF